MPDGREGAPAATGAAVLRLTGGDSRSVLEELAGELARSLPGGSPQELGRGLSEREALGPTALGGGVAVPHCRVRGIDAPLVVVGRHVAGIDFGAPDGVPVRLFVAVAAPAAAPGAHLRLLARLARALRDRALVDRLLGDGPDDESLAVLLGEEGGRR